MPIDARLLPADSNIQADLCVIGGGAAGIAIAHELANESLRIVVLESGGESYEEAIQALYTGENLSSFPQYELDRSRMRLLGGTTNIWQGNCRPLDSWDFEARDWIPYSGWPISRVTLDPYYRRAHTYCELTPYAYDPTVSEDPVLRPILPLDSKRVRTSVFRRSPPTNFARKYTAAIDAAPNIDLYLHATVLDIGVSKNGSHVTGIRVATAVGREIFVIAGAYVLATGGIENARMMLASDARHPDGIGNENDLVGRFFMEHPWSMAGFLLMCDPFQSLQFYSQSETGGEANDFGVLSIAPEIMEREQLGNFFARPLAGSQADGVLSAEYLLAGMRDGDMPHELTKHVGNMLSDLGDVVVAEYDKVLKSRRSEIRVLIQSEQVPRPRNRVGLSTSVDRFGKRQVFLDNQLSKADLRTIRKGIEIVGIELARAGIGRLRSLANVWDDEKLVTMQQGNHHHMGTTRMHNDPREGVVNADCKVHGIANLYVAGSSVFPTGGYANPTLTIVALALRLADHLRHAMVTGKGS